MSQLCIIEIKIKEYQQLYVVHVADMLWMISEGIDSLKSVDYFVFHYYTRKVKNKFQKAQIEEWGYQWFFLLLSKIHE